MTSMNIDEPQWLTTIQSSSSIPLIHRTIKRILDHLLTRHNLEHKLMTNKRIEQFIQDRCNNYTDNPKKLIDSLLECNKRFIVLDKLVYKDNNGHEQVTVDPDHIKQLTNDNFQNIAKSRNSSKEFSPEWSKWKDEYAPKSDIDGTIYDNLMSTPSLSEWHNVISNLPNHKATGPSKISNDMLKHLGPSAMNKLWIIISCCINTGDFPDQWKEAFVYPIPKPQEWHNRLNNTRPITLLDTVRKATVKLITNRLSAILVQHKILKGNNFAALPKSSTFEALRVIDNVLQDAKDSNKEIWFYLQDMSKAYDRVNICMLQHAMNRIKLPQLFIRFITNLFTNRFNRIFTPFGLTDPYNILVGIDQGEVICPLLWCIYYDPLLSFIQNNTTLGYELSTYDWSTVNDLVSDSQSSCLSERIPDTAFIDDTTWIAKSITDLQDILAIAQSFCSLNDIWINNDKATLLTNNQLHAGKECTLLVNSTSTVVKIEPINSVTRVLGVWISMSKSKSYVIDQIKDEITKDCNYLWSKRITDKQMLYIFNTVIVPRLEYKSQLTFISEAKLHSLTAPFRILFKHKLSMNKCSPNAFLTNPLIYNYRNLYDAQI